MGCKFLAGEAFIATHREKDAIITDYKRTMLERGESQASKYIQNKMNWSYSQAENFKKAYLEGHQAFKIEVKSNEMKRNEPTTILGILTQHLLTSFVVLFFLFFIMTIIWAIFDGDDFGVGFFITFSILAILVLGFAIKEMIVPDIKKLKK